MSYLFNFALKREFNFARHDKNRVTETARELEAQLFVVIFAKHYKDENCLSAKP